MAPGHDDDSISGVDLQGGSLQSVDRAIAVLKVLARAGKAGVTEVAEEMGVHKSTISRLLRALEAQGMVQSSGRGKYQLGLGILHLANSIPMRLDLAREARPFLEALAARFGETVNLAVLSLSNVINIDEAFGPSTTADMRNWMGRATPLHATSSGKVFLASLTVAQRNRVLTEKGMPALTKRTITSRQDLESQLLAVAESGYATVHGELEDGLNGIAVPIRGREGTVIAAVSISGPSARFEPEKLPGLIDELKISGEKISENMGYVPESRR
ncbi:IclR family transcriptional regulator [Pseudarthrobacter sp. J75]|uniref:IclR family transcriptional regulator n=1 Tax=unclassified Pseudarthrobacter TaxID=2647000 RepID=UPI002E808559|nr:MULTISPECIES: IclR family transcriptional regulator [unclassified Pseudarthrobacter]MEE2523803.1 IclR family transcriptional regulator [Pseudarthrobacter sp. J47]MEE2529969.1 IclR family transcriptional regulator [Pseudarthrobacter sp. J75]